MPGGSGTTNTVTVSETDSSGTYTQNETMIIYPPPVCAAAPGTTGSYSGTTDAMSSFGGGSSVAEVCDNGASGPASGLLTNVSPGGTVLLGSNAIDAAGGSALTIMAGPGFNWTGGAGSGEADVDTGTAGTERSDLGHHRHPVHGHEWLEHGVGHRQLGALVVLQCLRR